MQRAVPGEQHMRTFLGGAINRSIMRRIEDEYRCLKCLEKLVVGTGALIAVVKAWYISVQKKVDLSNVQYGI